MDLARSLAFSFYHSCCGSGPLARDHTRSTTVRVCLSGFILVCATPWGLAVLLGLAVVTQRLRVSYRLFLTGLSGSVAVWGLGLHLPRLGLPWLDALLAMAPWLGLAIVLLAVTGLPHAFNIIDGYNGLAGMVALIVCLALAHVALQVGDRAMAAALLVSTAAATAGFLVWNYPRGMLFAVTAALISGGGDCVGKHLFGAAQRRGLTVVSHAAADLPGMGNDFSIYRKAVRGVSPGVADALHFHQLIYRRIVRGVFHDDESRRVLMRNNRTSPYLWGFTLLTVVPAVLFWNNTWLLMGFAACS